MALVAVDAVVDISRHVVVLEVVSVVSAMAAGALENGVVVRVDMAGRANVVRTAMRGREGRVLRVIEECAGPGGCVVAVLACGWKELWLRGVAGIRGFVVIGLVAADADGWQGCVIVVHVAIGALPRRNFVRSGKGEGRVVVVKGGIGPDCRVVTQLALCGKAGRNVSGTGGAAVVLLVTRVTGRAVQVVVVVKVAIGALTRRNGVRSRERKSGAVVIESSIEPVRCVVARIAGLRETRGNVAGIRGSLVVL